MIPWLPFFVYTSKQRRQRNIKIENGEIHIEIPITYEKPSSASTSGVGSSLIEKGAKKPQVSPGGSTTKSRSPRATPSPHLTPAQKSQPTSARKSPAPAVSQVEPQPKPKFQKRGFETSQAMLELFGHTATGPSSCFEQIPAPKEEKHYGRKNLLHREMNQPTEWEEVKNTTSITSSCFQVMKFSKQKNLYLLPQNIHSKQCYIIKYAHDSRNVDLEGR
jgi:hypothetical protein